MPLLFALTPYFLGAARASAFAACMYPLAARWPNADRHIA